MSFTIALFTLGNVYTGLRSSLGMRFHARRTGATFPALGEHPDFGCFEGAFSLALLLRQFHNLCRVT